MAVSLRSTMSISPRAAHSIHAVLGENGAGKSTLIKIVSGAVQPDARRDHARRRDDPFHGPKDAVARGVVCVFQELSLIPDLSVAENICVTTATGRLGLINAGHSGVAPRSCWPRSAAKTSTRGCRCATCRCRAASWSRLAKALDAPAAAADPRRGHLGTDRGRRRDGLRHPAATARRRRNDPVHLAPDARDRGAGRHLLGLSQRPPHRDVRAGHPHAATTSCEMMIGREISQVYPPKPAPTAAQATCPRGLAGCPGGIACRASRSASARARSSAWAAWTVRASASSCSACSACCAICTAACWSTAGRSRIRSPADAKAAGLGLALVPEDRKTEGLLLSHVGARELTLAALDRLRRGCCSTGARAPRGRRGDRGAHIKTPSAEQPVGTLSGGNQQKVVLAKWLLDRATGDPAHGPDARHRRRHQAGVLSADAQAGGRRGRRSCSTAPTMTS